MSQIWRISSQIFYIAFFITGGFLTARAQAGDAEGSGSLWFYALLAGVVVVVMAAAALLFRNRSNNGTETKQKHQLPTAAMRTSAARSHKVATDINLEAAYQHSSPIITANTAGQEDVVKKYRNTQLFGLLPVSSFLSIRPPHQFSDLPYHDDVALLAAIDQVGDETEEEEEVRELAMRILAAFRTANSVTALSHTALYDISAHLRAKAVLVLSDFDHGSVFETLVIAGSDPSKEVRAAAARGLFKVTFDRADAWARIVGNQDDLRRNLAAKAAVEAGLVDRSFERLVHLDSRIAYEAFVLIMLLIKAQETDHIFMAMKESKDENVKLAIVHAINVAGDERAIERLAEFAMNEELSAEVRRRAEAVGERYAAATV